MCYIKCPRKYKEEGALTKPQGRVLAGCYLALSLFKRTGEEKKKLFSLMSLGGKKSLCCRVLLLPYTVCWLSNAKIVGRDKSRNWKEKKKKKKKKKVLVVKEEKEKCCCLFSRKASSLSFSTQKGRNGKEENPFVSERKGEEERREKTANFTAAKGGKMGQNELQRCKNYVQR